MTLCFVFLTNKNGKSGFFLSVWVCKCNPIEFLSIGLTYRMPKTRATMDGHLEVLERNVDALRKVMEDRDE